MQTFLRKQTCLNPIIIPIRVKKKSFCNRIFNISCTKLLFSYWISSFKGTSKYIFYLSVLTYTKNTWLFNFQEQVDEWSPAFVCLFSLYCKGFSLEVFCVTISTFADCTVWTIKPQLHCRNFNIQFCSSKDLSEEQMGLTQIVNPLSIPIKVQGGWQLLAVEMRISCFRMETEFYFTIFQS